MGDDELQEKILKSHYETIGRAAMMYWERGLEAPLTTKRMFFDLIQMTKSLTKTVPEDPASK